jgi:hypothetical protein
MQERPQDAAHVRVVVANEESELVEIDTKHAGALGDTHTGDTAGIRAVNHRPGALRNGCDRSKGDADLRASVPIPKFVAFFGATLIWCGFGSEVRTTNERHN